MKKQILFIALMILSMLSMNSFADGDSDPNLLCNCDRSEGEACNKSPETPGDTVGEEEAEAQEE